MRWPADSSCVCVACVCGQSVGRVVSQHGVAAGLLTLATLMLAVEMVGWVINKDRSK